MNAVKTPTPRQIKAAQDALSFAREAIAEDRTKVSLYQLSEVIFTVLLRKPDARLVRDARNGGDAPYEIRAGLKLRIGRGMTAGAAWRGVRL